MSNLARVYLNILITITMSALASMFLAFTLGRAPASAELDMLISIASLAGYEAFRVGSNAALVFKPGGSTLTIVLTSECICLYSMTILCFIHYLSDYSAST